MATDDQQILVAGTAPAPAKWVVPGNGQVTPRSVFAHFDGTSAAVPFFPALKVISDAGQTVGIFPTAASILAGGSGDVSWFPRLASAVSSSGGGTGPAVLFDSTLSGTSGGFDTGAGGIPGTHKDLLIATYLRTTEAIESAEACQVVINNDTVGTYHDLRIIMHNTTIFGQHDAPGGWFCMSAAGANADAGNFSPNFLYIPNYVVAGGHFGLSLQGVIPRTINQTNANVELGVHSYNAGGGAAITRLAIQPNVGGGALFATGSRCTIYGLG